ncbi:DEAD/DEAH box helicase [Paraglaciecola sp. MB-3u-78]|uniref:DEAD/DEAH box helicase n=1 Tax=Paraglaciecola sp. MB-3u-78 TaxID=2058332 RepID=UPI000C338B85|nr:DEAD/DEAH box helicase [Paraglaciecola sp. MB-3u-78]PKG97267.1 helicase SNF2 [Paraglaciecola sp. MB-3u-78]
MFNKTNLQAALSKLTWAKGARLHQLNHVVSAASDEQVLRGSVRSESKGSETYLTRFEYDESRSRAKAYCNCYLKSDCKHAAALAHHYLEHMHVSSASNHLIEEWLNKFSSQESLVFQQKKALLYFLNQRSSAPNDYLQLGVKSSSVKKSGGWSRTLNYENLDSYLIKQPYVDDQDVQIISSVIRNQHYSNTIQSHKVLHLLVSTGRCFWQDGADLKHPITLGEPLKANWQWQTRRTVHKLDLILEKSNADITLIKSQPISYYNTKTNRLGLVETDLNSEFDVQFLHSPSFSEEKMPWVLSKLDMSLGDLAKKLPKPKLKKEFILARPVPHIRLTTPNKNQAYNTQLSLLFAYHGQLVSPLIKQHQLPKVNGEESIYRDFAFEKMIMESLKTWHFIPQSQFITGYKGFEGGYMMMLQGRHLNLSFLHNQLPQLEKQGWKIEYDDSFHYQELNTDSVFDANVEQNEGNDFFSIGLNLNIDGQSVAAFPILISALEQLPNDILLNDQTYIDNDEKVFVNLSGGKFIALRYQSIRPLLKQFVELFMPGALQDDGTMRLSRFQGHQTLSELDNQGIVTKGANRLRHLAEKLRNFNAIQPVPIPKLLQAKLREYQHQGLNWLQFLREYELNGILADDMGLGKTIQTLSHLLLEKEHGRLTGPSLIIAPTSVLFNWSKEIDKFTPSLSYIVINGAKRQAYFEQLDQYDIVITSYPLVLKDSEIHQQHVYYYLILDEAHYIKNPKTKLYQSMLTLKAEHKLCLTGTPMENHLGEFWAQFNFLLPGFLAGYRQFSRLFKTPIEKHNDHERKIMLNQRIKPFILRRSKELIAKELPEKTIIIQMLKIDGKQAELYESVRLTMDSRLKEIIAAKGLQRSQIEILDALLKLRQVCNHPQLLSLPSAKSVTQSAKLEFLMETLPEMVEEGRKVLIFSQFTSMLALIEVELVASNIPYVKLTGSSRNRQAIVEQFQSGQVPVFLISLKAGGVGLNLTAADTVIHFDPWWNPAVENQATDRAYRIGQDNPVFVYKLIIENSIEEKILLIQKKKAELANALLSEEVSQGNLSLTDDILDTLLAPLS